MLCAAAATLALPLSLGCRSDIDRGMSPPPGEPQFGAEIHVPRRLLGLETTVVGADGAPTIIACETCHGILDQSANEAGRPTNSLVATAEDLGPVHAGLAFEHGTLSCASCHHPTERSQLRLADGRALPMPQVMTLCAQCHGPQFTSYTHGAHGGMAGHWDLSAGPRTRNNCVDCHDPHSPAYPEFAPMPGPNDRFLDGAHP